MCGSRVLALTLPAKIRRHWPGCRVRGGERCRGMRRLGIALRWQPRSVKSQVKSAVRLPPVNKRAREDRRVAFYLAPQCVEVVSFAVGICACVPIRLLCPHQPCLCVWHAQLPRVVAAVHPLRRCYAFVSTAATAAVLCYYRQIDVHVGCNAAWHG